MESLADCGLPTGDCLARQENIDCLKHTWVAGWTRIGDAFWSNYRSVRFGKYPSGRQRIGTVSIVVKNGETWAVDGESGYEFQVAVHATPVTGQWGTPKLGCLCLGDPIDQCARYPHPEAVLTCVDHCNSQPCVVVVFDGWNDTERLVRVTSAKRQLADPEG